MAIKTKMKHLLLHLFDECLSKKYTHTENCASFHVEIKSNTLFIYFEHSNGDTDWFNNLNFFAVPYCEMNPVWYCHGGFLNVWKSAKPYLEDAIKDKSIKRIVIAGYSHGAALAVLCHEYAYYNRPDIREHIFGFGFGCPRVLYKCPSQEIEERWRRFYLVQNEGDIVTHLPPSVLGFCHVGKVIILGKKGKYSPINAHRPESYRAELKKI